MKAYQVKNNALKLVGEASTKYGTGKIYTEKDFKNEVLSNCYGYALVQELKKKIGKKSFNEIAFINYALGTTYSSVKDVKVSKIDFSDIKVGCGVSYNGCIGIFVGDDEAVFAQGVYNGIRKVKIKECDAFTFDDVDYTVQKKKTKKYSTEEIEEFLKNEG